MPRVVSQAEWQRRAAAIGLEWLEDVKAARIPTSVRCLACGREWVTKPDYVNAGNGCQACFDARRGQSLRVPQAVWDERAAVVGIRWTGEVRTSGTPTPAHCLMCGHDFTPFPTNVQKGQGCPNCDLIKRPELCPKSQQEWEARAAAVGVELLDEVRNAATKVRVRCRTCGHTWDVQPAVIARGHGCRKCGQERTAAARRKPQSYWVAAAAALGLEWLDPVEGALTPTRARCMTCGTIFAPWPSGVARGHGCPTCAQYGFTVADPSVVYLLTIPDLAILKVGVANTPSDRLDKHRRRGWEVLNTWATDDGEYALSIEAAVLAWWAERGAVFCERHEVPAGDGFTESVHAGRVDVPGTLAVIEGLIAERKTPRLPGG